MDASRFVVMALAAGVAAGCAKRVQEEVAVAPARRAEARQELRLYELAAAPQEADKLAAPRPAALAMAPPPAAPEPGTLQPFATTHAPLARNPWMDAQAAAVSTFSIDVDTGSYTLARRMLREGQRPPAAAIRSEEFLNYFDHGYTPPSRLDPPFAVVTEIAPSPWQAGRHLLQVGLKGYEVDTRDLPPANLVFLIDTSGSMQTPDKLALLRKGFRTLAQNLRAQDRVAIVSYAGSAGLVLPSTPGDRQGEILAALDALQAGGSTNGGAGIQLAYQVAAAARIAGGINRVILATDGDFNVGTTSVDELKALVEAQRAGGVALTTLGFGAIGYNDQIAEQLADIGNGHHAYIDDELEARRVLVQEMGGTLLTIAKDVKVQLEFNPQQVARYRLVGYENRLLNREDFSNDQVDAGEIGAGHDVTALYELELREGAAPEALIAALRLRYKKPDEANSRLIEQRLLAGDVKSGPSERLAFAAAVAGFAEKLRGNPDLATISYAQLGELLERSGLKAEDVERNELRDLILLADMPAVAR
jgi:Ca-activated chloride channel homolog